MVSHALANHESSIIIPAAIYMMDRVTTWQWMAEGLLRSNAVQQVLHSAAQPAFRIMLFHTALSPFCGCGARSADCF